ncbi:Hypothetical protein PBC10988_12760 [Planctomycetales bacterium 10988]|nr:Hypothetical protein PBC10988_12760 [Planctomycetales bacterium 10988]
MSHIRLKPSFPVCSLLVGWSSFLLTTFATSLAVAQINDPVNYRWSPTPPPGVVGGTAVQRGYPVQGYYQPIRLQSEGPLTVAMAVNGQFEPLTALPREVGLLVGAVYRLKVSNIPFAENQAIYPTIELIDRIYPPVGREREFPIPIDLSIEDLTLALNGQFVTRVIYLENPNNAMPVADNPAKQRWFDAGTGANPIQVADTLGRPVAILRIGSRQPTQPGMYEADFIGPNVPFIRFNQPAAPTPPHPYYSRDAAKDELPPVSMPPAKVPTMLNGPRQPGTLPPSEPVNPQTGQPYNQTYPANPIAPATESGTMSERPTVRFFR